MPKLTIDGRPVEVEAGATILDAAETLGIEIPTMCYLRGHEATTSCMVCVVKVVGAKALVPSCGTLAREGMRVENDCEEVRDARRSALELLLSDHVGDCMGPCQMACPAHMNIPLMIRQIEAGQFADAIATVKRDIALPAVLGRICPAPCEKVCRRAQHDEAVSICLLKRFAAGVDLQSDESYRPVCAAERGKRVAIIGAGPAGLSAAYYLRRDGFACTVFDDHEQAGGMLRYGVSPEELPRNVLDAEIAGIENLGVEFRFRTRIGAGVSMDEIRAQYDAAFIGTGALEPADADHLGVSASSDGIQVDSRTYTTDVPGVFAGGDAVRKRRLTVRAVADGKEAAVVIGQYLAGGKMTGAARPFNSRMGKLADGEMETFLQSAGSASRQKPSGPTGSLPGQPVDSLSPKRGPSPLGACTAIAASRKRAGCGATRKPAGRGRRDTKLRDDPSPSRRNTPTSSTSPVTFIGRGFDVRVAVPFDASLGEGLQTAAAQCVQACPTGALAFRDESHT